jgi:hypothetical protein
MILELEENSKDCSLYASLDSLLPEKQDYFLSHDTVLGADFLLFARLYTDLLEKSAEETFKPRLLAWYNRMLINEVVVSALKVCLLLALTIN